MPIATVAELIDALRGSKLFGKAQLDELERLRGQHADARALSRELLQRNWLTPYQLNQILQGNIKELELGNYIILERLGTGGMGQVFKAQHRQLNKAVALKVMRREHVANPEAVHRFRREIRLAGQLAHPNIVLVLDADQVGDKHFFAMEFVNGLDLSQRVRQQGPLPVAEACDYIRQAAEGLQHAQERGMVHRDIKPGNLLLTSTLSPSGYGQVKLLDMGLARVISPDDDVASWHTQEGKVLGTPDYMAPEQALKSSAADVRADLYSLGCTFYYLLTGSVPFPGGSLMEKLLKHRLDDPAPIEKFRPEVPVSVRAIVRKLLAKKPEERFQSPAELVAALKDPLRWNALGNMPGKQAVTASPTASPARVATASLPQAVPLEEASSNASTLSVMLATYSAHGVALARRWPRAALATAGVLTLLMVLVVWNLLPSGDPKVKDKGPGPGNQASEFQLLAARARAADADPKQIRKELIDFRLRNAETPEALQAAQLLTKLPSPLDGLPPLPLAADEKTLGAAAGEIAVLGEQRQRHWGGVNDVAFSPVGQLLASAGGYDHVIRLWDPTTMRPVGSPLTGHTSQVRALAFRNDGKALVSASNDSVRLWRRRGDYTFDGSPISLNEFRGTVTVLAWHPQGTLLALAGTSTDVWLWDLDEGYFQLPDHGRYVASLSFSPAGRWLASVDGNGRLAIWELTKAQVTRRRTLRLDTLRFAYFLSEDLLVGGCSDGAVKLWNLTSTEIVPLDTVERRSGIVAMAVSGNGRNFVTADANGLAYFEATGKQLRLLGALDGPPQPASALAFAPSGSVLASGSRDCTVRLFSISNGKLSERFPLDGHASRVARLSASPRGRLLASAGFSDASVRLWNLETPSSKSLSLLQAKPPTFFNSVAFSRDGTRLAAAGNDYQVHVWSVEGDSARPREPLRGHSRPVAAVAFAPGSDVLASVGNDGAVWLWSDPPQKIDVSLNQQDRFVGIDFNATGSLLAVARESGSIVLWDIVRGAPKRKREFTVPGNTSLRAIAFAPVEAKTLAVGGENGHVTLFDVEKTRPEELKFVGDHRQPVTALAFNPTGTLIASADEEGKVIVWQFSPERKVKEWKLPGGVAALAFTVDGRYLATGNFNGAIYLFRVMSR